VKSAPCGGAIDILFGGVVCGRCATQRYFPPGIGEKISAAESVKDVVVMRAPRLGRDRDAAHLLPAARRDGAAQDGVGRKAGAKGDQAGDVMREAAMQAGQRSEPHGVLLEFMLMRLGPLRREPARGGRRRRRQGREIGHDRAPIDLGRLEMNLKQGMRGVPLEITSRITRRSPRESRREKRPGPYIARW